MAKHTCAICGAEVGLMSEQKLADGNYICRKVCSKKTFKIFDKVEATLGDVTAHIEQIEKGTKIWEAIFVPLMKNELGSDAKTDGANYAVRYGKDLYIFYDYRTKSGDRKKTGAEFTRSVLASNQDARHIFFLTHLPIFPCAKGNPGWIVPEFKELIPLLAKHKAIVLCGHSHFWGHHIYRSGNDKLVQFMITSIGYCWSPGTPLKERFSSYDQWKKEINPRYFTAANQWSTDNLKFFDNADFILYNSQYRIPSGFVRLEVDDSKVTAHIFTDGSGKPVRSVVLKDE